MLKKVTNLYTVGEASKDNSDVEVEGEVEGGVLARFYVRAYVYGVYKVEGFEGKQLDILIDRLKELRGEIMVGESKKDK